MRILVVEDERKVAADLGRALEGSGLVVEQVSDGETAWFQGDTENYDLVVLDLGLPRLDGLQVLKRWRANQRTMPVLVLTARDSWTEKVEAIDAGADDYLTKPFHMAELLRACALCSAGRPATPARSFGRGHRPRCPAFPRVEEAFPSSCRRSKYRLFNYLVHHAGEPCRRSS
jgi:DNA-binding response OmpR family regulator